MKILLHICCSNCAAYPFKLLQEENHDVTGFWFNPNIHPYEEYRLRLGSLKELENRWLINISYTDEYEPAEFFEMFGIDSLNNREILNFNPAETVPPHPERCKSCYLLRLRKTAEEAQKQGFDGFSTTLLISPYQDFEEIVTTGRKLSEEYNVLFYLKDFRPYFRNSMALAKELELYRQRYCGCIFSREEK